MPKFPSGTMIHTVTTIFNKLWHGKYLQMSMSAARADINLSLHLFLAICRQKLRAVKLPKNSTATLKRGLNYETEQLRELQIISNVFAPFLKSKLNLI